MVIFVDTPKPNAAEMNRFLIPRSRKDPALFAVRRGGETETRFGFLLKVHTNRQCLGARPLATDICILNQVVCSVRYLVAYSKTLLLGKILQIFKNKHYKGEEKIMLHYF